MAIEVLAAESRAKVRWDWEADVLEFLSVLRDFELSRHALLNTTGASSLPCFLVSGVVEVGVPERAARADLAASEVHLLTLGVLFDTWVDPGT